MKIEKKSVLIWITGLSGSGKTALGKLILPIIKKKIGPTILISGDDLRNIFKLYGYTKKERLENAKKFYGLYKLLTDQGFNVIFCVVSMFDKVRSWNKKNIKNYIEVYIKSDVKKIIQQRKKEIYFKNKKNIVGLDIKPQIPKNPDITIHNNFKKNIRKISKVLSKEIINFYENKL
jgi:adenylylsulfate kinase-like enzyme